MKSKYYKTEHFIFRQWDRGIEDLYIEKITCNFLPQKKKTMIIVGSEKLKQIGLKLKRKTNLIIIQKGKSLITLFMVDDLYEYLKSLKKTINVIIL